MKKKTNWIILIGTGILALQGLVACVSDISQSARTPLVLSASYDNTLRTRTANTSLQSDCFEGGETVNAYITSSEGSMNGKHVEYTADEPQNSINALNPVGDQPFFPNGDDVTLNVFALYPPVFLGQDGSETSLTPETSAFTVATDQTDDPGYKKSDLMQASVTGQPKTSGTVNLQFTHKMAKLIINVTGENNVSITKVTLKNVRRTIGFTPSTGIAEGLGETSDDIVVFSNDEGVTKATSAVLFPEQQLGSGDALFMEINTTDNTASFKMAPKTFHSGNQYTLNLAVGPQNLNTTSTIPLWADAASTLSVAAAGSLGMVINGDNNDDDRTISNYTYNGEEHKPTHENGKLTVVYGEDVLTENTDYTLEYFDNQNAGRATVVAIGQGNYAGAAAVKSFTIDKAAGTLSYKDKVPTGTHTVTYTRNGQVENLLTMTGDGTVAYSSSNNNVATISPTDGTISIVNGGETTITATVTDGLNYAYATKTASFTLKVDRKQLSDASIEVTFPTQPFYYTGSAQTPSFNVVDNGYTLTSGTNGDYTIGSYSNNTNRGTASVTITATATSLYAGSRTITFAIQQGTPVLNMSTSGVMLGVESNTTTTRTATITNMTGPTVLYDSSDPSVATVDNSGKVTAKSAGTTTITAYVNADNSANQNWAAVPVANSTAKYTVTVMGQTRWEFVYKGSVETWEAPADGTYKLEVWGGGGGNYGGTASGENSNSYTAGGHSWGNVYLTKGTKLYICVGGRGVNQTPGTKCYGLVYGTDYNPGTYEKPGGYNGGGNGGAGGNTTMTSSPSLTSIGSGTVSGTAYGSGGSGGGATHIAIDNDRGVLKNYVDNPDEIIIVAGGGGGSSVQAFGGEGGGESGNPGGLHAGNAETSGTAIDTYSVPAGTQTEGYQFGQGENGAKGHSISGSGTDAVSSAGRGCGGGGGGWYGGRAWQHTEDAGTARRWNNAGGAGGSGHLNMNYIINETRTYGNENGVSNTTLGKVTTNTDAKSQDGWGAAVITIAN